MDTVTIWLIIAAVLFGVAIALDLAGRALSPLIPAGLLCLAIAFIAERN